MCRVLAIANIKGGVGKTTTTANLAAALAEHGRRVLAVDLDPQASLTLTLGVKIEGHSGTVREALAQPAQGLETMLLPTRENFDILPSNHGLRAAEHELNNGRVRVFALRDALVPVHSRYDFILVDCPASMGILTGNALAAADHVIIPFSADYLTLQSMDWLLRVIRETRALVNPKLHVAGFLLAMFVPGSLHSRDIVDVAMQRYGMSIPFLTSRIPLDERVRMAPLAGQTVVHSAPGSPPALAFSALAEEVEAWLKPPEAEEASALVRRGKDEISRGDKVSAYRDFFRATELAPDVAEGWIGRAQSAPGATEVIRCWAKALQYDASNELARNELGNLVLHRIARSQPTDVPELLRLGNYLVGVNQPLIGELIFRRVTRLDPTAPGAWLGMARAAADSRMALGYCERAVQLNPEDSEAISEIEKARERLRSQSSTLVQTARQLAEKGERDRANELFLGAAELDPQNDLAWLGSAHTTRVQRNALEFAERALQANPENEGAKNLRRWLWAPKKDSWDLPVGWQTWASMAAALIILALALIVIQQHLGQ